jgi:ascorbate-specific PTS system EIIC-type component UlaA
VSCCRCASKIGLSANESNGAGAGVICSVICGVICGAAVLQTTRKLRHVETEQTWEKNREWPVIQLLICKQGRC